MDIEKRPGLSLFCRRLSVQGNGGLSPAIAHDFDISHAHAVYENARAKRLAYRLFGREARSVMRCGDSPWTRNRRARPR